MTVALGLLLVVALAPVAHLAGARPLDPPPLYRLVNPTPTAAGREAFRLQLPEGLPRGTGILTPGDVRPYAVAAVGQPAADRLMAVLAGTQDLGQEGQEEDGTTPYPYRFPTLDAILDTAPADSFRSGATALGAALIGLAARPSYPGGVATDDTTAINNASTAAFAVLDRARASAACAPQLDLVLLLASDPLTNFRTSSDVLGVEQRRTESTCPHDPRPGWLVGEGQLRTHPVSPSLSGDGVPATSPPPGVLTMRALVARFPRSPLARTGLGDAYLIAGAWLQSDQPFTARTFYRAALDAYNHAAELGAGREAAPGQARALIGLGDPGRGAKLLAPLLADSTAPGGLLEVAVAAQEAAHHFATAERLARRLDTIGGSAYPAETGFVPDVGLHLWNDTLRDTTLPLSWGAEVLSPLQAQIVPGGGAGATTQDISFIPQYRESAGLTGTVASCAGWTWRRDAVLAGHARDVAGDWPDTVTHVARPSGAEDCFDPTLPAGLRDVSLMAAGQWPSADDTGDQVVEQWQNLLRWAGDLSGAQGVVEKWLSKRGGTTAMPALRLGEIEFLRGRYDAAALRFRLAGRASRIASPTNDLIVDQAQLDQGTAALAAGRGADAEITLRPLDQDGARRFGYQSSTGGDYASDFAAISYFASVQLGDLERETGRMQAAAEDYEAALAWKSAGITLTPPGREDVVANDAALTHLELGHAGRAAELEARALHLDPQNPAYLMTAGYIEERRGELLAAERTNRQVLESDPGAYPAANDLGVELARTGQPVQAERALRTAVGARQDYALGWFNLGVLESDRGPAHLLAAEDALGRAYALDPALRERRPVLTIDGAVYRTALDLSKPLPPAWSFAGLNRRAPVASAGLLALVTAGLALARSTSRRGSDLAEQWLDPAVRRLDSLPLLGRLRHTAWALAATVVTFLLAELRGTRGSAELVAYSLGVLGLVGAAMCLRWAVAWRRRVVQEQQSWGSGIIFGLATGAAGFPWAPLPVVRTGTEDDAQVHLAAPVTLAAVAVLLFAETVWLRTPITHAWAVAALIMAASVLLPVGPLDGAHAGRAGVVASAGLVATALFVGLGLF